jgi:hypothetical protein
MQNLSRNSSERRPGHEINEGRGVTFTLAQGIKYPITK